MSITNAQFVEKVWYALSKGQPEMDAKLYRTSIAARIDDALQLLADRIASGDEKRRALLQKYFSLTLAGGMVSLGTNPTILVNTIPKTGYLLLSGLTQPLCYVRNMADLISPPRLTDFYYYGLFAGNIVVRDYLGAVPSATALTVYASFVPLIAQITQELEDEFVKAGVDLALQPNTGENE